MSKISLLALLMLVLVSAQNPKPLDFKFEPLDFQDLTETNGTEAYFFSPHGLGRTPEVGMALDKIVGTVKVHRTTYNVSAINYVIDNVTLGIVYNPSKQQVLIPKNDFVQVSGGRFQFTYKFNYTKTENRNVITGYAYGSVLTDNITYYKQFSFCGGFLCWRLPPAKGVEQINITKNSLTLKRMEPYNDTDLLHLQEMLDNATINIDPVNVKSQFLPTFNQIFPPALNDSLNHEIFGEAINYTYHSSTHGDMKMNIIHQLHGLGITPELGYKVIFVTKIDGFDDDRCNITVPLSPASFEMYGGSQTFHLNCLYETVVYYLQSNGWLNTVLNSDWEVDAFQFYAGDLFDLINNLNKDFSPRAILDGSCEAQKENLKFYSAREFDSDNYALLTTYKCSLKGTNLAGSTAQVMRFTLKSRLYITVKASTKTLEFKISSSIIDDISFEPVGNYFVNNFELAKYRASKVFSKVVGTQTFGSGFPTVARELPKTRVDPNWVFYYDSSHIGAVPDIDTA